MQWEPRKLTPSHYRILVLHWNGLAGQDIAAQLGVSTAHVSQVVNCQLGKEILQNLMERSLSTIPDLQQELQAIAPQVLEEKVELALNAKDERVRNIACTDILNMAGHQPVKTLRVEKAPIKRDLSDATEDDIRTLIRKELGLAPEKKEGEPGTVH